MDIIYSPSKALCAVSVKLQSKPGHFLPLTHTDIPYVSHITRTFSQNVQPVMLRAWSGGGVGLSHNPDQGAENEAAFEMQIAHCVPAQSTKSTVDVSCKSHDPIAQ